MRVLVLFCCLLVVGPAVVWADGPAQPQTTAPTPANRAATAYTEVESIQTVTADQECEEPCAVICHLAVNPDLPAFVDQQFADFPDFSTYEVIHCDVLEETELCSITTYFTNANGTWPLGDNQAVFNVVAVDCPGLPPNDYDPSEGADGQAVTAVMAAFGDGLSLTADLTGLGVILAPGTYAFGLTPSLDFGVFGQEFHNGTDVFDCNSAARNPGGGFGNGTDWFEAGPIFGGVDWAGAITVCGQATVATGGCCQCDEDVQFCTIETEEDCAALEGEYLGDGTVCEGSGGEQVIRESTPNVPIPDCDAGGVTDIIDMGLSFEIQDLEVDLIIDHTWLGDVCVTLQKDGGDPITLVQRMNLDAPCDVTGCCGCSSDGMDILLDDEGDGPIEDQCGPGGGLLTGTWIPDEPLSTYVGGDSAGTWTISVNDNACADTGTLVQWSLHFTQEGGGVTPCEEAFPDQCVEEVGAFLDIKPGSCPNPLNVKGSGFVPVSLVGTEDFDVMNVDVSSLRIRRADGVGGEVAPNEGPPGPHTTVDDVATPFEGELCDCHELEGDGIYDLMMHFSRRAVVEALELAGMPGGADVALEVVGNLLDGTEFVAADCITIRPVSGNGSDD